jgi:hypothetical protein
MTSLQKRGEDALVPMKSAQNTASSGQTSIMRGVTTQNLPRYSWPDTTPGQSREPRTPLSKAPDLVTMRSGIAATAAVRNRRSCMHQPARRIRSRFGPTCSGSEYGCSLNELPPSGDGDDDMSTVPVPGVADEHRCARSREFDTVGVRRAARAALSPGKPGLIDLDNGCRLPLTHGALLRSTDLTGSRPGVNALVQEGRG